jgi:hypothetical protein
VSGDEGFVDSLSWKGVFAYYLFMIRRIQGIENFCVSINVTFHGDFHCQFEYSSSENDCRLSGFVNLPYQSYLRALLLTHCLTFIHCSYSAIASISCIELTGSSYSVPELLFEDSPKVSQRPGEVCRKELRAQTLWRLISYTPAKSNFGSRPKDSYC